MVPGRQRLALLRALIRRIVDSVADGGKYHLKVVFSDDSTYHSTQLGEPDVSIVFRNRSAERRMALGGVFEFLAAYFDGGIDIVGEQGLRKLVSSAYRKAFGRFEHPLTFVTRRLLDHQLLPHRVREGPFRAPGPDHAARAPELMPRVNDDRPGTRARRAWARPSP